MKRWQALTALAALFALGVLSGALGAHLYYARALERPPGPPPFVGRFAGPRLEHRLDLSAEQRLQLREILEDTRREAERLRHELAPRMREVMERSDERIREILTPEQRERFAELRRRQRGRSDRFLGGSDEHPRRHRHRPPGGG